MQASTGSTLGLCPFIHYGPDSVERQEFMHLLRVVMAEVANTDTLPILTSSLPHMDDSDLQEILQDPGSITCVMTLFSTSSGSTRSCAMLSRILSPTAIRWDISPLGLRFPTMTARFIARTPFLRLPFRELLISIRR